MATSTTNLGLTKPAGTDKIRIAQINGNMDILDDKIGAVGNTSLQAQLTSQNQAISNRVVKLDLGASTTSNNPMAVLQESFASMEVGVSYTGRMRTARYTWLYTGLKYAAAYGVFHCWTYATTDAPQIITNYNGTWSSEELALKSDLSSLITEELKYSESVTIGANTYKAITVNVTKSGYTPFGIVGYNSFDVDVFCVSAYIADSATIGLTLRNLNSSSKSGTFGIRVAYKKNL